MAARSKRPLATSTASDAPMASVNDPAGLPPDPTPSKPGATSHITIAAVPATGNRHFMAAFRLALQTARLTE
ncbi:MAG TPA: hypothetical protein VGM43_25835 [Bryobacteraceae bacterium]